MTVPVDFENAGASKPFQPAIAAAPSTWDYWEVSDEFSERTAAARNFGSELALTTRKTLRARTPGNRSEE